MYVQQCKLALDVALVSTCGYTGQLVLFRYDECVKGGDSILVDALAVLERLRHTHPQHFSTLARVPTNYHRVHDNRCRVHIYHNDWASGTSLPSCSTSICKFLLMIKHCVGVQPSCIAKKLHVHKMMKYQNSIKIFII